MKWTQDGISAFSGRRNLSGYTALFYAVEAALIFGVDGLKMEEVLAYVQEKMLGKKSKAAISKALSRVTADIWDHGDRDSLIRLCGYERSEKPSPKELIIRLAEAVSRPQTVEYRVLPADKRGRLGIEGSDGERQIIVVSFPMEDVNVEMLVGFLNREQISIEEFEDRVLSDRLPDPK